jgi:hypothetical protein
LSGFVMKPTIAHRRLRENPNPEGTFVVFKATHPSTLGCPSDVYHGGQL